MSAYKGKHVKRGPRSREVFKDKDGLYIWWYRRRMFLDPALYSRVGEHDVVRVVWTHKLAQRDSVDAVVISSDVSSHNNNSVRFLASLSMIVKDTIRTSTKVHEQPHAPEVKEHEGLFELMMKLEPLAYMEAELMRDIEGLDKDIDKFVAHFGVVPYEMSMTRTTLKYVVDKIRKIHKNAREKKAMTLKEYVVREGNHG